MVTLAKLELRNQLFCWQTQIEKTAKAPLFYLGLRYILVILVPSELIDRLVHQ